MSLFAKRTTPAVICPACRTIRALDVERCPCGTRIPSAALWRLQGREYLEYFRGAYLDAQVKADRESDRLGIEVRAVRVKMPAGYIGRDWRDK